LTGLPSHPGLLGGVLRKASEGRRAGEQMQQQIEQHRSQLERYEALCAGLGEEPADVALAWLLHNPVVTATIIGPRTTEQFNRRRRALEITLSEKTLRELDDIWPGPGGEAPQAHAW
jgi:aryl-alcohol dehydrogenase-like predicted oxidoreductase